MAYADTYRSRNRTGTIAAVAGLHLMVGYVLVTGLAAHMIKTPDKDFGAINIPLDPPPPPPPQPQVEPPPFAPKPFERPITIVDPVFPLPQPTFTAGPTPLPTGSEGGVGTVAFPTPEPTFSPAAPRFTPKAAVPIGNPANWVSEADYPQRDIRDGNEGTTRFRLSISAEGRVTSCTVTGSSGFASLDAAACNKLSARGRFKSATGENGEKVAGSYASSIKWQIPED